MPPLFLLIKPVSGQCNLACSYCFYRDCLAGRQDAADSRMSMDTLEHLVVSALDYATGQCDFAFQGGEPTLAGLAFYEQVVALQQKHNRSGLRINNSIQTNGYSLNPALIDFFVRHDFLVGLSLDGSQQNHDRYRKTPAGEGSYLQAVHSLLALQRAGAAVNLLCVVHQQLAQDPQAVFHALKAHRFLQFIACMEGAAPGEAALDAASYAHFLITTFSLYYQSFLAGEYVSIRNFDNYIRMLLGHAPENCAMAGRCQRHYLIEANGDVYPCDFYAADQDRLANLSRTDFFALEQNQQHQAFLKASQALPADCAGCRWLPLCRNGCQRDRVADPRGGPPKNRWCQAFQPFFEACYPRMRHMAALLKARS